MDEQYQKQFWIRIWSGMIYANRLFALHREGGKPDKGHAQRAIDQAEILWTEMMTREREQDG
jgi:hypothetical protein